MVVNTLQLSIFLLIIARVAGIFMTVPILSDSTVSRSFKAVFMVTLTFLLWFVVPFPESRIPQDMGMFMLNVGLEFLIGYMLGMVTKIVFCGIEAAGDIMGAQMGLSVASMLDPSTGRQTVVTARILRQVVIMLFLMIDGLHFVLTALYKSYDALPLLQTWNFSAAANQIAGSVGDIFAVAVQLAAPILLVIFLLDFAFGLVSRVAPQINVFQLGFQMKPALGLFIFMLMIPLLLERITWIIGMMVERLMSVFFYMQ
ncbi:flagellar biosynthetic protein FliR [Candidatus Termititenax persephonae]|uniref:Flagellar biosynthetic protein FliR n=1 Tax=Candidatus Termititenax persephonae TaxID=2218525 RepID=A0A388THZ9_9BACT|nr:flagellar biosynthetic protein FliR [Candidatus Termititenax persephonae]